MQVRALGPRTVTVRNRVRAEKCSTRSTRSTRAAPRRGDPVNADVNTGRATLALDDLLTDPRGRELLAEVNAGLPRHLVDQLDAARDDTLRMLKFEAPLIGGKVTKLDFAGM